MDLHHQCLRRTYRKDELEMKEIKIDLEMIGAMIEICKGIFVSPIVIELWLT